MPDKSRREHEGPQKVDAEARNEPWMSLDKPESQIQDELIEFSQGPPVACRANRRRCLSEWPP